MHAVRVSKRLAKTACPGPSEGSGLADVTAMMYIKKIQ